MKLNWIFAQHLSIQLYWCVRYVHTILIHDKEALADLWMLVVDIAYLKLVKSTHNSRRLRCSGRSPHLHGFVFPHSQDAPTLISTKLVPTGLVWGEGDLRDAETTQHARVLRKQTPCLVPLETTRMKCRAQSAFVR